MGDHGGGIYSHEGSQSSPDWCHLRRVDSANTENYSNIEYMAVEDTACPEEAEILADQLGVKFPKERIFRSKMTPVIGTHTGPGLLLVAILGEKGYHER